MRPIGSAGNGILRLALKFHAALKGLRCNSFLSLKSTGVVYAELCLDRLQRSLWCTAVKKNDFWE